MKIMSMENENYSEKNTIQKYEEKKTPWNFQ